MSRVDQNRANVRQSQEAMEADATVPIETILVPPSQLARYSCTSIMVAILATWVKYTFVLEEELAVGENVHSWRVPSYMTLGYLLSLPLLRLLSRRFLAHNVDVKVLLRESMILYNGAQVALNLWTVYKILYALIINRHPFVSGPIHLVNSGATFAVWVHYCNKYLEFMDTYFMVLRGKMNQVRLWVLVSHCSLAGHEDSTNLFHLFYCRFHFFTCTTMHLLHGHGGLD
jgi:elongation of very long chain fatty acids protein 4